MASDLALQPERKRRVVDACLSRDVDLLDAILLNDVLQALFELVGVFLVVLVDLT